MNVAMLVNNPCVSDARVIREAEALAAAGHGITVLACAGEGVAPSETINGVSYHRLPRGRARQEGSATHADGAKARRLSLLFGRLRRRLAKKFLPLKVARLLCRRIVILLRLLAKEFLPLKAARFLWRRIVILPRLLAKEFLPLKAARFLVNAARFLGRRIVFGVATPTVVALYRHWARFGGEIERLKPDVIHAHDLHTLWAGWLGARRTGARLIYDSHELEMARNGNYSAWHRAVRHLSERLLIKKADAVITVCESIADHLAEHYRIARPVVILNAPQERPLESAETLRRRLGLTEDVPLCISVGKTASHRGLDYAVRALPLYPEAHLALVGPRDERIAEALRVLAADLDVTDRIHFVDPVPHYEVLGFVASADVSLILVQNICLSYYMCFPNKLLESLLAGLPVVAGRLIELERVVGETGAGVIIDETNPEAIAQGIREVVANRDRYSPDSEVLDFIRRKYGWDTQRSRLVALYESLRPVGVDPVATLATHERSTAAS